jgi:lysophospholipase L1-like esterase
MRRFSNPVLPVLLAACLLLGAMGAPSARAFTVPVAASFSTAVPANRQSVIALQGSDAEGTSLVYATTSSPSHGALSGLNTATGYVVYTPTAGYTGSDSFNYTVTSGGETSTAGTVTLTVTTQKTTVTDTITDPSGAPRSGKVTFILTQAVTTPAGLTPVGSSVSAALNSSGTFTVQLYPSRSMSPAAYYQVWFNDAATLRQELLGVYDIPAATTPVGLAAYKVTDTNLAARYTFASQAGVEALAGAVSSALITAELFPHLSEGSLSYWDGSALRNSNVTQSGGSTSVAGDLSATGAVQGSGFKVGENQVVGPQGYAIADPEATVESNTAAIKELLALLRGWGAVGTLYRSTLNDGLVSFWQFNNVNDSHGSNHLTNSGGVTFNSAGANFSGSNHFTVADNASFHVSYRQSFTFAARVRLNSKATTQAVFSKTDGASANEYALYYVSAADGFDRFRWNVYPGGNTQVGVSASTLGSPSTATDYLVVTWYDAWENEICIQVNNGTADCTAATLTSHPFTATFAVGAALSPGANSRLNGSVRFLPFWDRYLTAEERTELFENQAELTYPLKDETTARLEHLVQNYSLWDNYAAGDAGAEAGGYFYALPYSRNVYTTTATSMDVSVFNNTDGEGADARHLNVRVNGADYALVTPSDSTGAVTTHTVALPVGQKTVEIWSGLQTIHGTTTVGTWLQKVTFNQPAEWKRPNDKTPRLVVYGDSIPIGGGSTVPVRDGWAMQLRDAYPGSLSLVASGGRSLVRDAPDAPTRAAFVARIAAMQPDHFLSWIGTNSYGGPGFGEESAADFGTRLAAFFDELHAARPTMTIHAASMLPRTAETANTYGNTLAQYRTQVQTVCAARASYCTFIDGTAVPGWVTGTDLADTVHPNNSGHTKIANYVMTFYGL